MRVIPVLPRQGEEAVKGSNRSGTAGAKASAVFVKLANNMVKGQK